MNLNRIIPEYFSPIPPQDIVTGLTYGNTR